MGKETPTSAQQRKVTSLANSEASGRHFKENIGQCSQCLTEYAVQASSSGKTVVHRGGMLQDLLERACKSRTHVSGALGPLVPHHPL